jgi:cytochrome P450
MEENMNTRFLLRMTPPLSRIGGTYGNILLFWANPTEYMQSLYTNFGDVVPIGYRPTTVFAFGPKRNHEILSNTEVFQNHSYDDISYIAHSKDYARELTMGLGFLNGPDHRKRRRLLQPSFLKESVDQFTQVYVSLTERFLESWDHRETFEIYAEMEDLVMTMGVQTIMGLESNATAEKVKDLFEEVFGLMFSVPYALFPFNLPGTTYRRAGIATQKLSEAIKELVEHRRSTGAQGNDILSQLIRLQEENPDFTDTDLVGTTAGLFRGLYPNLSSALVCCFFMLALHPEVTQELLEELQDQLHGRSPTSEDLPCLPLLEGVVMETMRILPPAYWLIRISRAPFTLGSYDFPTNTNIFLSSYVTQRMPEIYPEPDRFLPQRWIGKRHEPYAFIPFAVGIRRCLGEMYAINLCKTVVATILQRYSVAFLPHSRLDIYGVRRPVPRAGTLMQIGSPGARVPPADLDGNYKQFVRLDRK